MLVDRLGQRAREPADARLVVADRQQRHERAPVGALQADAPLVERAVDGDAVGERRAHVDDQLERIARADGRVREHAVVEQLHARRSRRSARAPAARAPGRRRAARGRAPRAARGSGRSSANRLADGLVVSSTSKAASSRPRSRWPVSRASSTAPGVNEVRALCVEIATASAPSASAEAGTPGWKPKCAGPGLVADQRDAARVRELGDARDVRHDAEPGRLDQQDRARAGLGLERGLDRLDRMAERDAAPLVDGGSDPHRSRAREHDARGDRLVRAARDDHGLALGGDREAERLVGMRGAVAGEAAEVGAERARREALGLRPEPLAAAQVVRAAVPRRVAGQQRVVADQRGVALVPRRRERRRRLAQEGVHRVGERCLGSRHVARRYATCGTAAPPPPRNFPPRSQTERQPVPHPRAVPRASARAPHSCRQRSYEDIGDAAGRGGAEDDLGPVGRVARRADERVVGEMGQLQAIRAVGGDGEDLRLRQSSSSTYEWKRIPSRPAIDRDCRRIQRPRRDPLHLLARPCSRRRSRAVSSCRRSRSAGAHRGTRAVGREPGNRSRPGTWRRSEHAQVLAVQIHLHDVRVLDLIAALIHLDPAGGAREGDVTPVGREARQRVVDETRARGGLTCSVRCRRP